MRLIDRYILREFWPFFALVLGVTIFILFLNKLLRFLSFVLRHHLDIVTFLRFLGYTLPTVSGLAFPIALLIACILTFNRLSTDNEYIVLKAAGISLYRLLVPLLAVAGLVYGLSSVALMYGSPWGFQGLRRLVFEVVARSQAYYYFRPQEFNDVFKGFVLYAERVRPELRQMEGLFLADTRTAVPQVITARRGELVTQADTLQVLLRLHNGMIHRYAPAQKRYHLLRFGQYDVRLDLDTHLARRAQGETRPRELFPAQLQREIQQRQAAGKPYQRLLLFQYKLFALPFAAIIFAGIGPVLGIVQTRSGRSGGYVLGLLVIFIYYIFLTASTALGEETTFPPLLAAWLPNLCMGALTVLLLHRADREATQFDAYGLCSWPLRCWRQWHARADHTTTTRV